MKKLGKKFNSEKETIESYIHNCGCQCSVTCTCANELYDWSIHLSNDSSMWAAMKEIRDNGSYNWM